MDAEELTARARINGETAKIPWCELQRFFAQGIALSVADTLDLVEVAYQMSCDNKALVERWLNSAAVRPVSDTEAAAWITADRLVWSVVVRPWILVQPVSEELDHDE